MSEAITVQGVPAQMAQLWWPRVAHWCEAALSHGEGLFDLEDIKRAVSERDMQLWVVHEGSDLRAVCITEIRRWPKASALTALVVGGKQMDKWAQALDAELTRFARFHGCKVLDGHGRRGWLGWARKLRDLGWRECVVTYAKEINHE